MNRTYHRTKDGQQVTEHDAFDERGRLRDGFTMRTKLTLIDGVPVAALTDEQKRDRIARYNAQIGDAWRNPSPVVGHAAEARVRDATRAAVTDHYERYDQRLQDAWRS